MRQPSSTILGYAFSDPALLELALTHRSAGHRNNERLEFLGDGLLNALVAELLYERHPASDEGEMTRMRALLVNGDALADVAREAGFGDRLVLGPGELGSGGFRRGSILAGALEAVFGAIFLDGGWVSCREVARTTFGPRVDDVRDAAKDAKTTLQEWLQARGHELPRYELVGSMGEGHAREFESACRVPELGVDATGRGASRRASEQQAARRVFERLAALAGSDD